MAEILGSRRLHKELPKLRDADTLGELLQNVVTNVAATVATHPHVELTSTQRTIEAVSLGLAAVLFAIILILILRIIVTLLRIFGVLEPRNLPKKMN